MVDNIKVMIIEDDKEIIRELKDGLEQIGNFQVKAADNIKNILEEVKLFSPDVILLDLIMPTLGGLEVCEILNNEKSTQHIPIIVITGLSKVEDRYKAYKLGVVDYITKPVVIKELIFKIRKALQKLE